MSVSEEIKRLHELNQAGALSDEEFARAKQKLLDTTPVSLSKDSGASDFASEFNRFRRSRSDRWLGGVCGGLGKVSGMESWIWRLVFTLFTICFGFGLVIYLLLWIFVPDES
ncbi:hypothetical protein ASD15_08350 [Massilia sp. Root351]|jgi:phage shock protein PspC (stress-responsive transcriptional regulator)|uniref:PspC domain-containing protein n=1 Tax=Massilia sp. Root351 TaxID=1736522 RepID=UPI00070EF556|nr:PspC domain-containing protein [Massilia sp. Root351]KQV85118.1 hypothetical protein ASD15_08350 [Massilia sp. Root351]